MKKALIKLTAHLIVALPFRVQLKLGYALGVLGYLLMKRRRKIALRNLQYCFPELSEQSRKTLCLKTFQSIGMGIIESLMAWFMSEKRIAKIPVTWIGKENFDKALSIGKGVILLSAHTTCVDLMGRLYGKRYALQFVYKPSRDQTINDIIVEGRLKTSAGLLKHSNMKAMVSALRQGGRVWFAPDQDFGRVRSVFVPFCGQNAATIVATSILAEMGRAAVIPVLFRRTRQGYEIITKEAVWENFPTGDDVADTRRYNDLLTEFVKKYPDQYLWIHRRFKTTQGGVGSIYEAD